MKFPSLRQCAIVLLFPGLLTSAFAQSVAPSAARPSAGESVHELFSATSTQLLKDLDREKARAGFLRVVQLDDNYGPAWFDLGVLAEAAGDWTEARFYFRKYLSVAPTGAYEKRAQRELKVIEQRSAQAAPTVAQQYDAAIDRAWALLSAKIYKESILEAAAAQGLDESRWEAYAVASLCLARQNRQEEARKYQRLSVAHAPVADRAKIAEAISKEVMARNF